MANYIISPYAISYNSIKNALESYINDKSVSQVLDTWSDFYVSGAGQTVVELDAAIGAFYAFHFIIGRRESYLPTAQNYNSVLGGAESLGYNASRGKNLHVSIKIKPIVTQTLAKWTVLGSFDEYQIILWEDTILTKGEEITLHCVVGNSAAQSFNILNSELQQFTFTAENTTDDCRLVLNDTEVPVSSELKDAMNDNYLMLSNSYGSVDVFYLNRGLYNYNTGDVLYLHYIERNNLKFESIDPDNVDIDYGDLLELTLISERRDKQDKESIRIGASIYHETNNVVRARKDYAKYLLQENDLNLLDTNDLDINPGLIALTYLKEYENGTNLMTQDQKDNFLNTIMKVCPDGVADAFIEDPVPVIRHLNIQLWQKTGEVIPANVADYIEEILDAYRNKLAVKVTLEDIENELEKIPGVKIARVDIGIKEYLTNTKYKLYDIIEVENVETGNELQTWRLICSKIKTLSGSESPDWGSTMGTNVYDGDLVWKRNDNYIDAIPNRWKAEEPYDIYNNIAVGYDIYPHCTTRTEPVWGPTTLVDGNVTFNKVKTYDYVLNHWEENKAFELDECVTISAGDKYAVCRAKKLLSNSGLTAPDWASASVDDYVYDNAITWITLNEGYNSELEYNTGTDIGILKDNQILIYGCVNSCNKDTIYENTGKTGSEQSPFDGSNEIYSLVERVVSTNTDPVTGEITEETELVHGDLIWELVDTYDYTEWEAYTEIPLFSYTFASNKVFRITDVSNSMTGSEWFSSLEAWPEENEVVDNNIIWELDSFSVGVEDYLIIGTTWYPLTEYSVNQALVEEDEEYTYVYKVIHSNDKMIVSNNIPYDVVNFCGKTGEEVTWGDENVEDGNILWTKTNNPSDIEWKPNTTYTFRTVIKTEENGNYVFSSLLGTSGNDERFWARIKNNIIEDNNIVWQKLDKQTTLRLKWNEYLDLSYELVGIN